MIPSRQFFCFCGGDGRRTRGTNRYKSKMSPLHRACAALTRKLHQAVCAVCCTAFRRNSSMPAKAGTTNVLRVVMQFPITRRVSLISSNKCPLREVCAVRHKLSARLATTNVSRCHLPKRPTIVCFLLVLACACRYYWQTLRSRRTHNDNGSFAIAKQVLYR